MNNATLISQQQESRWVSDFGKSHRSRAARASSFTYSRHKVLGALSGSGDILLPLQCRTDETRCNHRMSLLSCQIHHHNLNVQIALSVQPSVSVSKWCPPELVSWRVNLKPISIAKSFGPGLELAVIRCCTSSVFFDQRRLFEAKK